MSTVAHEFSNEQIATLIWLKILDEFKEGKYNKSTFAEKYLALVLDEPDLKECNFEENVKFWVKKGLLKKVEYNEEDSIELTEKGKALFKIERFKEIANQLYKEAQEFADKHKKLFKIQLAKIINRLNTIRTDIDNMLMAYCNMLILFDNTNTHIVYAISTLEMLIKSILQI